MTAGRFVDVTARRASSTRDGRGLGVAGRRPRRRRQDRPVRGQRHDRQLLLPQPGRLSVPEESGSLAGLAANAGGGYLAGMGVACGDLDGDGRLDLAVTNFYGESTTLYHNHGDGIFSDRSTAAAASPRRPATCSASGSPLLDANNDGRLDLVAGQRPCQRLPPGVPYAMPAQLFLGTADGQADRRLAPAGPPWQVPRVGRGLAAGDLDNDGRIDLLFLAQNEPLAYLHNLTLRRPRDLLPARGHRLEPRRRRCPGQHPGGWPRQVGFRYGGGSYQSASDPRIHFGLGSRPMSRRSKWPGPPGRSVGLGTCRPMPPT